MIFKNIFFLLSFIFLTFYSSSDLDSFGNFGPVTSSEYSLSPTEKKIIKEKQSERSNKSNDSDEIIKSSVEEEGFIQEVNFSKKNKPGDIFKF